MIKLRGKLVYDPIRPDFKKTHKVRTLILELPRDQMDLYYQWFLMKQYGTWIAMQRPMYGLHVTVVRGNEKIPANRVHLWKKYSGKIIEIEYDPSKLVRHWEFWSLPVHSPNLVAIREELGLHLYHNMHITVGRQYNWQPKLEI